jgi:hypothetical protein
MTGRCSQTRVSWGTSVKDHRPNAAMRSSTSVSRPQASSPATHRQRRRLVCCTAWSISQPRIGLVVNMTSLGTPQRCRRSA